MKLGVHLPLVLIASLILLFSGCNGNGGSISSVDLRSESISVDKATLLESFKSKHLYCPGENISGDLLLKNRFEAVVLYENKVVNDHVTGLMWQQDEVPERFGWKEAEGYLAEINSSEFAGYSDWRIPSTEELASLLIPRKNDAGYLDPVFHKEILSTWTCDEFPDMPAGAWFVDFLEGKPVDGNRAAGLGQVRLVRSFQ